MAWKVGVLGMTHDHVWEHIGTLSQRADVTLSVADVNVSMTSSRTVERGRFPGIWGAAPGSGVWFLK